jgi:hypothetical protein
VDEVTHLLEYVVWHAIFLDLLLNEL